CDDAYISQPQVAAVVCVQLALVGQTASVVVHAEYRVAAGALCAERERTAGGHVHKAVGDHVQHGRLHQLPVKRAVRVRVALEHDVDAARLGEVGDGARQLAAEPPGVQTP